MLRWDFVTKKDINKNLYRTEPIPQYALDYRGFIFLKVYRFYKNRYYLWLK